MLKTILVYISEIVSDYDSIPRERRGRLEELAAYIKEKITGNSPVDLVFICTHNSRRSQLAQVWAHTATYHYRIPGVASFSGGIETTAFNPAAILVLVRAGFRIEKRDDSANPVFRIRFAEEEEPVTAFSKIFSDPVNPLGGFTAVMTCSDADEACPVVPGAESRFSIPYEDPKVTDNTPEEKAKYDERCRQIATEMFYLFGQVNKLNNPINST